MSERTVRAPAKINLHLGVGAPRGDGFHPLVTVYQAIGLHDDVTVREPDAGAAEWAVEVDVADWMRGVELPPLADNIVTRAADLLAAHHGVPRRGAVHVAKAIPVAGGMAGGSADAAAALVALDRLWGTETSDEDLLRLAAELGSDVPFALVGGTALGTGRGEVVERVPDSGTWWWVAVPAGEGLSTPAVYRHFDAMFPDAPAQPRGAEPLLAALAAGDVDALAAALHNDLQAPAVDLRPELGDLLARGEAAGALRGLLSGSGPTCLFLCRDGDHAREVAAALAADTAGAPDSPGTPGHPSPPTVLVANGAVAGAHLVEYA